MVGIWFLRVVRRLSRQPLFTGLAIATVAVAISSNTLLFSAIKGVLLEGLSYRDADGLMVVWSQDVAGRTINNSVPDFLDYRDFSTTLTFAAATGSRRVATGDGSTNDLLEAAAVSGDFMSVLGVAPMLGQPILPEHDLAGGEEVVVLTHGTWVARFGGDSTVVGRTMTLDGTPYRVLGIMPPELDLLLPPSALLNGPVDILIPLRAERGQWSRSLRWLLVVARRPSHLTLESAQLEMDRISAEISASSPDVPDAFRARLVDLKQEIVGPTLPILLAGWIGVILVLLVACTNLAGLVALRSANRTSEVGLRRALGATRLRLLLHLLEEPVGLAAVGGVAGFLLAALAHPALIGLMPDGFPRLRRIRMDGSVAAFSIVLALAAAALAGVWPAWKGSSVPSHAVLAGRTRSGRGSRSYRPYLVGQIAVAYGLAVSAGLLLVTSSRLSDVDLGFDARGVDQYELRLPSSGYPDNASLVAFYETFLGALAELPGVASGVATELPLEEENAQIDFYLDVGGREVAHTADFYGVSRGTFDVLDIDLRAGRLFDARDRLEGEPVIIVDDRLAEQVWPGRDPVGETLDIMAYTSARPFQVGRRTATVVGVVGHVRSDLRTADEPQIYQPISQVPFASLKLVVRPRSGVAIDRGDLAGVLAAVDPTLAIDDAIPARVLVDRARAPTTFVVLVTSAFALAALLLTAVGVFAISSRVTLDRKGEVGVRMALGSGRRRVVGMVLEEEIRLLALGVLVGVPISLGMARVLASQLYGVGSAGAVVFAGAGVLILSAGLLAVMPTALGAAMVHPSRAMKGD